jgi:hypothetical protein
LEQYDLSPSTETSPARDNSAENSPNLLELDDIPNLPTANEPSDSSKNTHIGDTTPTPQDDEMEEDKDVPEDRDTTPNFTPTINNLTHEFLQETDLDDNTLDNESYTSGSLTNITADATLEPFQTEEAPNKSFQTSTEELDKANQTLRQHDITTMIMRILRETTIKDAIHEELTIALHD